MDSAQQGKMAADLGGWKALVVDLDLETDGRVLHLSRSRGFMCLTDYDP